MTRLQRAALATAAIAAALASSRIVFHGQGEAAPGAPPPPPVVVAAPLARDVTEWDDYVGRFRASQVVEVRPRVPGQVTGIYFVDGQIVQKGQLLFAIDQRRFLAGWENASADVTADRTILSLAQTEFARGRRLTGDSALSTEALEELRAKVESATAALTGAQARLRDRSLDLEFSEVRAPISGRISDRRVDIGNEVAGAEGNSGTLLTTIDAVDPIYFDFDASEALFLKSQRAMQAAETTPDVEIRLQDEVDYRWKGKLDFTDNAVNPRSGTIRGRAVLANASGFLRPGLFGNMRLASGGNAHVLLVPDAAVRTDQARQIVLIVDQSNTVLAKEVIVGPLADGLRVIRSGLTPTDRVVIDGIGAVPGMVVAPQPGKIVSQPSSAAVLDQTPAASQATIAQ